MCEHRIRILFGKLPGVQTSYSLLKPVSGVMKPLSVNKTLHYLYGSDPCQIINGVFVFRARTTGDLPAPTCSV